LGLTATDEMQYPQWTGHRDRRGIPIYVYVIKHLDSKNVHQYSKQSEEYKAKLPNHKNLSTPAKLLPLFALYHNLLGFVLPLCSSLERPNPEIPVTNSTNIVDISHVGLTQFWNLKAHMQDASVLATAHYPETLDRIFVSSTTPGLVISRLTTMQIIGAPSFFPTVWGWIKRWFDPVTVSKIFILGKHEVESTLSSFIDPKDFPRKYGGELDWNVGDLPHVDKPTLEALERDGKKGWVRGPALWMDHRRVVVGSENGKPRRSAQEIARLKPIVYAADYTEEPVHPERKSAKNSPKKHRTETNGPEELKKETEPAIAVSVEQDNKNPAVPTAAIHAEDVRPLMDAHLPKEQPETPLQIVEYVSSEELHVEYVSSEELQAEYVVTDELHEKFEPNPLVMQANGVLSHP
jgi:CRAL/TRIO domain